MKNFISLKRKIESLKEKERNALYIAGVMVLLTVIWNYSELKFPHTPESCGFLQNIGFSEIWNTCCQNSFWKNIRFFLHSLYHNIAASSLNNAASFCSLFALVIALVQTIYPYRLGKTRDFPITKLDKTPVSKENLIVLSSCAGTVIVAEFFGLYLVETSLILIGYGIIITWLIRVVNWYQKLEDSSQWFMDQAKANLKIILDTCMSEEAGKKEEGDRAREEFQEILERNIQMDGIEEREFLKEILRLLSNQDEEFEKIQKLTKGLGRSEYKTVLKYSFYFSYLMAEKCSDTLSTDYSWHYRILEDSLLKADYDTNIGKAFIRGTVMGCLAANNEQVTEKCIENVLLYFYYQKKMTASQFSGLIGYLCVFLELYCDINDLAITTAYLLINSKCLKKAAEFKSEETGERMAECYNDLVSLKLSEGMEEYDIVISALQLELSEPESKETEKKIPRTVLGALYRFTEE